MRPVPKQAKMFAPTPAIACVDVRIAEPVASCYCPRPSWRITCPRHWREPSVASWQPVRCLTMIRRQSRPVMEVASRVRRATRRSGCPRSSWKPSTETGRRLAFISAVTACGKPSGSVRGQLINSLVQARRPKTSASPSRRRCCCGRIRCSNSAGRINPWLDVSARAQPGAGDSTRWHRSRHHGPRGCPRCLWTLFALSRICRLLAD